MGTSNTKYKPEYADQAATLALLGATDRILAAVFGVCEDTVRMWKHTHPEFMQKLNAKKAEANAEIARTLYERARGYSYKTQKAVKYKKPGGGEGVKVITVTEHAPANVTACIFFLKNRAPELWRDVQRVEHSGLDGLLGEIMNTSRGLPSQHPTAKNHTQPPLH